MKHFRFILFLTTIAIGCLIISADTYANDLEIGNGFFYNNQFDKAINYYSTALKDKNNDTADLNYKIGLCYFLKGDKEKANASWNIAKAKKPSIFKGKIFRIPSDAMAPTLIVGDNIIIDPEYYKYNKITRGDIVVYLDSKKNNLAMIKRIVGLPMDTIIIKDKKLFINGSAFFDKHAVFKDTEVTSGNKDNLGPITVPDNQYFVLSDNRDQSYDSRFYGAIDEKLIIGKALAIYFSAPDGYSMDNALPERAGMILY